MCQHQGAHPAKVVSCKWLIAQLTGLTADHSCKFSAAQAFLQALQAQASQTLLKVEPGHRHVERHRELTTQLPSANKLPNTTLGPGLKLCCCQPVVVKPLQGASVRSSLGRIPLLALHNILSCDLVAQW